MVLYIGLTIVTVLLGIFVQNPRLLQTDAPFYSYESFSQRKITRQQAGNVIFLSAAFLLLFAVSAGRYYVGNDYGEYVESFQKIYLNRKVSSEFGFNAVVRCMQFLCGKDQFIPIFALFSFGTVLFYMKAVYDQADWFFYGFFLFMMSGFYFSSLNTMRYYFALGIAMYAAKYVIQKQYVQFVLWILFAALFHKTVLFVLPVYWIAARPFKKWEIGGISLLCLSLVFGKELYRKLIFMIYPYYENTRFDTGTTSYLNIIKGVCILIFALLFYKQAVRGNAKNLFYFQLNLGALLIYLFASFIPEVSRIGFYCNAFQIFLIPNILNTIKEKKVKLFFSLLIGAAYLLYFAVFLHRAGGVELRILPYRTWLL